MTIGGGAFGAVSAMRSPASQAARHLEARRELKRALRHAGDEIIPAKHVEGPCAWVCIECGRMALPVDDMGDPMRGTRGVSSRPSFACPHCQQFVWLDLGDVGGATALREREAEDHRATSPWWRAAGYAGVIGSTVLGGYGMIASWTLLEATIAFMGGAMGALLSGHGIQSVARRARRRTPFRWARPALSWRAGKRIARGVIACDRPMTSPLCGVSAAACIVTVEHGMSASKRVALVEQRCAALRVGDLALGHTVTLDLAAGVLVEPTTDGATWLLQRGLEANGGLVMRESLLAVGTEVDVFRDCDGGPAIVVPR